MIGQVWEYSWFGRFDNSSHLYLVCLYLVVSEKGNDSQLLSLDTGNLFWMGTELIQNSVLWRRVV